LLSQLKDIHNQLRETIAQLADLLAEPNVNLEALSRTRMKLTRVSGQGRAFLQCTVLPALRDVPPAQARQIDQLRRDAAMQVIDKSNHLARWSARATQADLAGYKRASADMRRSMLQRIEQEAAVLYPLLEAKMADAGRAIS
jgi:uncharacterized protein (DUF2236 family)